MKRENHAQPNLVDNSPMALVDALAGRINQVLGKSWWSGNEYSDEMKTPHVHAQFLPIVATEDQERNESRTYPMVQVFLQSGKIEDKTFDNAVLKIIIMFGGWSDDNSRCGWRIPAAMMWAVLQDLCANPFIGAYEAITPIEWTYPPDDEPPYWTSTLVTTWKCGAICEEVSYKWEDPSEVGTINFSKE